MLEDIEVRELITEVRAMREQLIRMDERMNMVQDHETRLRGLEQWRYALPASLLLSISSGIAFLVTLLQK